MRRMTTIACGLALFATMITLAGYRGSLGSRVVSSSRNKPVALGTAEMTAGRKQQVSASHGRLPLTFEANHGQIDPRVRFVSRGSGYSIFLTDREAVLALSGSSRDAKIASPGVRRDFELVSRHSAIEDPKFSTDSSTAVLRVKLMGANPSPQVVGVNELPGKSNYFRGNDPSQWHTNVPTYATVKYQSVYPGIDLVYHGNQRQLEYDFVVAPGAHPQDIRLSFRGAESMEIDAQGDLVVHTAAGEVREHKPVVYQEIAGRRQVIAGGYVFRGDALGFVVSEYDSRQPLVIDPVLSYSTYLGGSSDDFPGGIAVDAAGNAYVTGWTSSTNFPTTTGAFQTTLSGGVVRGDVFVTKLSADGSALLYSTYLGSDGVDFGSGIAVDAAGNAYITGSIFTYTPGVSTNFPVTPGAFQTTFGGGSQDGFMTKLNANGSALLYSTYLAGSAIDIPRAVAVDAAGNAYLTGDTNSANFPTTTGVFQTAFGGGDEDAFVTELNADGSALIYSTYLGGSNGDFGYGIAVDATGNAYLTGLTSSPNFPTTSGPFQPTPAGGSDAFVTKLNANGSALIYSTYLGGGDNDSGYGIAVDSTGNAYVTGQTISGNFPATAGAFQTSVSGSPAGFVTKLNADGSALSYSSYLSGSGGNGASGIAVDSAGNAYVIGEAGAGFPTTADAVQKTSGGGSDAFVAVLNASGSALITSTYLGGRGNDGGTRIALDPANDVYLIGITYRGNFRSPNFPTTTGAFQRTYGGGVFDALVAKIAPTPDFSLSASALSPGTVSPGGSSTATVDGAATGGFSDSVALSCSVQPTPAMAPRCSINPSSITPGTLATLTVSTTGASASALRSGPPSEPFYALCLLGLAVAGVGLGPKHRRMGKLSTVALASVVFASLVFLIACGGSGGGSHRTPAGTYTITVAGTNTSGSLKYSATTTLAVQ